MNRIIESDSSGDQTSEPGWTVCPEFKTVLRFLLTDFPPARLYLMGRQCLRRLPLRGEYRNLDCRFLHRHRSPNFVRRLRICVSKPSRFARL